MPNSQIFAVNNSGRVFTLLTNEKGWQELEYLGIEFKKVSAHEMVVWALGGDHQIYVYVYGTTVPVRVCEESFENQVSSLSCDYYLDFLSAFFYS